MRRLLTLLLALAAVAASAHAQRHSVITSPPTAPPPAQATPTPAPIVAVSSGLGPLQFTEANASEPAPEALARQLQAPDERIRAAALSAIGTPAAYLAHGAAPLPHSVQIEFVALSNTGQLDAILTAELDLHLVSAVLVPSPTGWRRIATITYTTAFADPTTNLGTFVHVVRSLMGPDHYTAIFHGASLTPDGDLTEHEAHLSIFNAHAAITLSFVSHQRICEAAHLQPHTPHTECDVIERWLQAEPADGTGHVILVTASGRVSAGDAINPVARAGLFDFSVGRIYSCQPFLFNDQTAHYEPTADAAPCFSLTTPHPAAKPVPPPQTPQAPPH